MINDEELPRFLDIMVDSYKKHLLDNEYITSDVHVPAMVKSRLEMVLLSVLDFDYRPAFKEEVLPINSETTICKATQIGLILTYWYLFEHDKFNNEVELLVMMKRPESYCGTVLKDVLNMNVETFLNDICDSFITIWEDEVKNNYSTLAQDKLIQLLIFGATAAFFAGSYLVLEKQ